MRSGIPYARDVLQVMRYVATPVRVVTSAQWPSACIQKLGREGSGHKADTMAKRILFPRCFVSITMIIAFLRITDHTQVSTHGFVSAVPWFNAWYVKNQSGYRVFAVISVLHKAAFFSSVAVYTVFELFGVCDAKTHFLNRSLTNSVELSTTRMCSRARTSRHFIEPEGSLSLPQEPSTCPYPEPDQSSPYHSIPPLKEPSWYYPPIHALSF
jgi:hypothetical protein